MKNTENSNRPLPIKRLFQMTAYMILFTLVSISYVAKESKGSLSLGLKRLRRNAAFLITTKYTETDLPEIYFTRVLGEIWRQRVH